MSCSAYETAVEPLPPEPQTAFIGKGITGDIINGNVHDEVGSHSSSRKALHEVQLPCGQQVIEWKCFHVGFHSGF